MELGGIIFLINIILLIIHEMDAVRCREWAMLFGLNRLKEQMAYLVFTVLHIPIYFVLIGYWYSANYPFLIIFDYLFIVHALVHVGFRNHKENRFDLFSNVIIFGLGVSAILHLLSFYF